ncbi:unnamed protein product [Echinostoma caproni]|uniref:Dentin sialophosphoprotein-like n=1 Tax=Echinostoma caproni TaxID=27848 RepID=A0A183AD68_9TREM|nr:unnamed protein product [Echinostoma caproni]
MFAFTESIERLNMNRSTQQTTDIAEDQEKNRPESNDWRSSTQDDSDTNMTEDDETTSYPNVSDGWYGADQTSPLLLPSNIRTQVTVRASQPLKNLAKQMHVSSSYRVEKKIAQAIDELGLFPLNLIHSPSVRQPDPMVKSDDYCAVMLNNHACTNTSNPRTAQAPIARLKIKTSILKSPTSNQDPESNGNLSSSPIGSPSSKRRRRSAGSNKICSPQGGAERTLIFIRNSRFLPRSQSNMSPKVAIEYRLVNGLKDPTSDAAADGDCEHDENTLAGRRSHLGDDDDGQSVGSRARIRHSDQIKHCKSVGGDPVLSPSQYSHVSSRSSHHAPPSSTYTGEHRTENETRHSGGPVDSTTLNGEVFTFDHEDTVTVDEKRGESRLGAEHSSDADACPIRSPLRDQADTDTGTKSIHKANEWAEIKDPEASRDRLLCLPVEHKFESDLSFLLNEFAIDSEKLNKNLVPFVSDGSVHSTNPTTRMIPMDEVGWAILQRQHELRMVCAANHSVLRRLVQAARRDVQRQEIQRRLAIADADVIEAYNKLESYRPLRKPPLKRDRDMAWKALKERRKILKELEAFDACSP